MLQILKENEFDLFVNMAYEISADLSHTSFPIYTDGVKTREDFIRCCERAMKSESEELLLFVDNDVVEGVLSYYVLKDDQYIGVNFISVQKHYTKALKELLEYWSIRYKGFEWDVYFPEENKDAIAYMTSKGHKDLEQSAVDVLFFEEYELQPEKEQIIHITPQNYHKFADIHKLSEEGMYWTSEKILENLEDWELFVSEGEGAIYYSGKEDLEIFGIDFKSGSSDPDLAKSLLTVCLNHAKENGAKSMYLFCDSDIDKIAVSLGFRCITVAHFFSGKITEGMEI